MTIVRYTCILWSSRALPCTACSQCSFGDCCCYCVLGEVFGEIGESIRGVRNICTPTAVE